MLSTSTFAGFVAAADACERSIVQLITSHSLEELKGGVNKHYTLDTKHMVCKHNTNMAGHPGLGLC